MSGKKKPNRKTKTNKHKKKTIIFFFSIAEPFEVVIGCIKNIPKEINDSLFFEIGFYHGGQLLTKNVLTSKPINFKSREYLESADVQIRSDLEIWQLPEGVRLCLTLFSNPKKPQPIGWVGINLVDFKVKKKKKCKRENK